MPGTPYVRTQQTIELRCTKISDIRAFMAKYEETRGHKVKDDDLDTPLDISVTYLIIA